MVFVSDILDSHLEHLDSLDTIENSIFSSQLGKERYESILMYAVRKYGAANYHRTNLVNHINKDRQLFDEWSSNESKIADGSGRKSTFIFTKTCDEYVYELSAFLEALKSALDLLSEICSLYIQGVTTNYSISPLIRLVKKGNNNTPLDVVAQSLDWIIGLRNYRHHLVHRLMPSLRTGHREERIGDKTARAYHPVVVPYETPSFVPDTRSSQMMQDMVDEDQIAGLDYGRAVGINRTADGTEQVVHLELSAQPSHGYVTIDRFVTEHLNNFESFFQRLIQALDGLAFKSCRINQDGG